MKKSSNFLRSSKDALTKSFNSAKCKTSLKLASSRLKLLRNKKELQLKQMKRELAQLLESGQNQTARIRVMIVLFDISVIEFVFSTNFLALSVWNQAMTDHMQFDKLAFVICL
nr:dentin sialophosphoprotein-like [Ipomoea batatas]